MIVKNEIQIARITTMQFMIQKRWREE